MMGLLPPIPPKFSPSPTHRPNRENELTTNSRDANGASPQQAHDYALLFTKQPTTTPPLEAQPDRFGVIFPLVNSCVGRLPRAKDI